MTGCAIRVGEGEQDDRAFGDGWRVAALVRSALKAAARWLSEWRMMGRLSLREFLDRERIDPRVHGLDGPAGLPVEDREERYFLKETPSGWSVC